MRVVVRSVVVLLVMLSLGMVAGAFARDATALPPGAVAEVDGVTLSEAEFEDFLAEYARANASEGAADALAAEALDAFIVEHLLLREADRAGIVADDRAIEDKLAKLADKYKRSGGHGDYAALVPHLRARMVRDSRIDKLRDHVMEVAPPSPAALKEFYANNQALFMEIERLRVSEILIGLAPSATADDWVTARRQADVVLAQVRAGVEFAELARTYSAHSSAEQGGLLGLIRKRELADGAQAAVDALVPGEVSAPLRVREGYLIVKLHERLPARLLPLAEVRKRAIFLYTQARSTAQWDAFLADVKANADIVLRPSAGG